MSENLSSVGKVINTVVRIATTGGILWTQFGCTSTVSAPSAEPEPTTKPTTNVPTAYDAGSEYENKVAQAIRDGGDPCVDPSSILFDAGTPKVTADDGILTICTNPTTGEDSIYNQPAGSYKVSKLDIAVDPSARTITGFVIEETETKPTQTPQAPNPNDMPDNVPQSQLKLIFQADITKEQIVYSPTGVAGDATIYNVTPSFRPDYERFTKNAGFIESPALQPSATLEPTATVAPTETPALDPETWNQYGSILVKNGDIAPYGKQLTVNSELGGKFGETVFTLCNHVSYLAALANEFSKSGVDAPPAPTGDLKDFNTYIANVIQPAIDSGKTVEGSHLVAHDKYANKQPGMGMVEPIPNFNPAKCVIKIDGSQQIYPNSLMIDAGSYQIGMDTITLPDGNVVRRLLVNVALTRPKYQVFSANNNTSVDENATAFSQMLNVASENITKIVNEIPLNKSVRDSFVMGPTGGNKSAFSYATTQQAGIDFILEHMADAPMYFVPQTP